jgi:hypothetical protein
MPIAQVLSPATRAHAPPLLSPQGSPTRPGLNAVACCAASATRGSLRQVREGLVGVVDEAFGIGLGFFRAALVVPEVAQRGLGVGSCEKPCSLANSKGASGS